MDSPATKDESVPAYMGKAGRGERLPNEANLGRKALQRKGLARQTGANLFGQMGWDMKKLVLV
jgi:hypothetical protein